MEWFIFVGLILFIVLFLGFTEFWESVLYEFRKPARMRKSIQNESYANPIEDMLRFKRAERARLMQQWDKEYLELLPVGERSEKERLVVEDKPTEKEVDQEFTNWQKEITKARYNAKRHQSYY